MLYLSLCVSLCVSLYLCHLFVSANRGQQAASNVPGLELQAVVKHRMWMLGTKSRSFPRAASALNHSVTSPALIWHFVTGEGLLR